MEIVFPQGGSQEDKQDEGLELPLASAVWKPLVMVTSTALMEWWGTHMIGIGPRKGERGEVGGSQFGNSLKVCPEGEQRMEW